MLEANLLAELDSLCEQGSSRSRLIEKAVEEFTSRRRFEERDARDLAILDEVAEQLNEEVEDVLSYQGSR